MPNYSALQLEEVAKAILKAGGALDSEAETVARHLVASNAYGTDSHGVQLIKHYVKAVKDGFIVPGAKIDVAVDTPAVAVLDANQLWGQVVGERAMNIAIEKAEKMGIGIVTVRRTYHLARIWDWPTMALEHDMIGMAGTSSDPIVTVPGGNTPIIGTNPICYAIPAGKYRPIILDCATSASSGGKVAVYASKGLKVPEGWILNKDGKPTTDPNEFLQGGSLLPRAGYFGFSISMMMDTLAGILSGHGPSSGNKRDIDIQSAFFGAINIRHFMPVEEFKAIMDKHIEALKNSGKFPGVQEITIPGEPEFGIREKRLKEGIPIPDSTWNTLVNLGRDLNVNVEEIVSKFKSET